MIPTLLRSWWLLIICGLLDAIYSFFSFLMEDADGSVTLRKFAVRGTVVFMGRFALAAGVCALAAGIWNFRKSKSWLLMLHGIALSGYGPSGCLALRFVLLCSPRPTEPALRLLQKAPQAVAHLFMGQKLPAL